MSANFTPAGGLKVKKKKQNSDWTTYRRLLAYLKGTHWVMVALLACMIFEAAFTVASIGMVKPLVAFAASDDSEINIKAEPEKPSRKLSKSKPSQYLDQLKSAANEAITPYIVQTKLHARANPHVKFAVLLSIITIMLLFGLLMVIASFGTGYLSSYLSTKTVQRLRNDVYRHMVGLDMSYFASHSTGSMMSHVIQDVSAVEGAIDVLFSSIIKNPIKAITFLVFMIIISPSLTLITFLIVPVIGSIIFMIGRRIRKVSQRVQKVKAILSSILEETFTGMRVIKSYNMENTESRRFEKRTREVFRMGLKTTAAEEFGAGFTQFLGLFTVAIVVLIGAYFVVVLKKLGGDDFAVFVLLLTQIFRPLKGASKVTSKIQKGLAGCDRVFAVLDTPSIIVDRPGAVPSSPLSKSLQFDNVTFAYSKSKKPALKNINIEIPAGGAIALVGETGSGKSTMANLIPRFYDPTKGAVLFDGQDIRNLQIKSLRDQISIVSQDVVLFDDSVANNIAYGLRREVPMDEIIAAAKAAKAHGFIMQMPKGYESFVGSRGSRLSGGERQRLAIARAILKDAPILIMDEATSALDSETEALIQEALSYLIKGRTTIVIAHRLSTIQNCDRIYVLDEGTIIEEGSHSELVNNEGRYARFHSIQFSGPGSV